MLFMIMKKIIYVIFMFSLFSCMQLKQADVPVMDVSFDSMNVSSFIGLPVQLVASDSVLYVSDFYGDTLVHCLSLADGHLIEKIGVKGNGPNEMQPPLNLFIREDSLYLYSRPMWTLYCMHLGDLVTMKRKFTTSSGVSLLFPFENTSFLSSGMFDDNRFQIFDAHGILKSAFGFYPEFWAKEKELSSNVKYMFHQMSGYAYSRNRGIAIVDSHVLSLYTGSLGNYALKNEVLLAPYEYDFKEAGISSQTNLKPSFMIGARELVASDDYIYILFDVNRENATERLKKEIWKFDWEGNLLVKLIPNIDICLFTMTPDGRIVALSNDENPSVLIWDTTK